ncbi:MAG: helix-turn-helix transcriptional regulator [Ilumatobacteraceae bacterium]
MADRVERLTNLLALLLETREPLSLVAIADELAGQYPDGHSARRGAFERDKAALREIGVPIEQEIVAGVEDAGQTRYWIDRDRYELRGLDLDDDEMRALQVAMAATRPGSSAGQEALWKLGAGLVGDPVPVAAVVPDVHGLPTLRDAVAARHGVAFGYRDVDRIVDPWGLLLRDGFWYLVGFDHGRGERRTYRIDRIEGEVVARRDAVFERPEGFDPRTALPDDPKDIGVGPGGPSAVVLVDAVRASQIEREVGAERVVARHDDGSVEVLVPCGNEPAFRSWLFGLLDRAEVLGPDDLRERIVAWLKVVAS